MHLNNVSGQVQAISPFEENFNYSMSPFGGRGTGIPFVDQIMMMALGDKMHPLPQVGSRQSLFDATWRRERDLELLRIRNHALANSLPFKKLGGVNESSPIFSIMGPMLNDPDGIVARTMAPLIGGNPIKAQMAAFSHMRGLNMSGFGTMRDANATDMSQFQDILYGKFYNYRNVDASYLQKRKDDILNLTNSRSFNSDVGKRIRSMLEKKDLGSDQDYKVFQSEFDVAHRVNSMLSGNDFKDQKATSQVKKAADQLVESLSDGPTKEKFKKAIETAIKDGSAQAFRTGTHYESMSAVAGRMEVLSTMKQGTKLPVDINFKNTYGFAIEDLSSAYTAAARHRMLGAKGVGPTAEAFFSGRNVSALDSVRSLFGNNLTGSQLVDQLNNFLGVSTVDLSNSSHTNKLEGFARGFKAMARTLNISIEQMLDIANTAKDFAAQTPGLQGMGGLEIGSMMNRIGPTVMATAVTLDDMSLRRVGGTNGLMQRAIMGKMAQMSEPIAGQLAALHYRFQGNSPVQESIRNFATGGLLDYSSVNKFIHGLARQTGTNFQDLLAYSQNVEAQNLGMAQSPAFQEAGGRAATQAYTNMLYTNVGGGARGNAALRQLNTLLSSQTVNLDEYMPLAQHDTNKQARDLAAAAETQWASAAQQLQEEGIMSYEAFMSAAPETQQKYGGLHDALFKLKMNAQSRLAVQTDRYGRAIPGTGKDNFLTGNLVQANRVSEQQIGAQAAHLGGPVQAVYAHIKNTGALSYMMRERNPNFREIERLQAQRMEEESAMEKALASRLGFLNSPYSTQFFNQLLGGHTSPEDLFKTLGIGPEANEAKMIREAHSDISALNLTTTYGDLGSVLAEKGLTKEYEGKALEQIGSISQKHRLTGEQLAAIGEIDSTAGKRARIQEYLGDKASDFDNIISAADKSKALGLGGIKSQIDLSTLRKHYKDNRANVFRDVMKKGLLEIVDTQFKQALKSNYASPRLAGPEQMKIAAALQKTSLTSTDELNKVVTEDAGGTFDASTNTYTLTGGMAEFASQRGFKSSRVSKEAYEKLKGDLASLPEVQKYLGVAHSVKEKAKDAGKSNEQLLSDIDSKLGSLTEGLMKIVDALNKLKEDIP